MRISGDATSQIKPRDRSTINNSPVWDLAEITLAIQCGIVRQFKFGFAEKNVAARSVFRNNAKP
jgi:hypothetical protein